MIRMLAGGFCLLTALLAGCTSLEEKEAQLEFERLRRRTVTPQGDRVLPIFGPEASPREADPSAIVRWSEGGAPLRKSP